MNGLFRITSFMRREKDLVWSFVIMTVIMLCQTDALLFSLNATMRLVELGVLVALLFLSFIRLIAKKGWQGLAENPFALFVLLTFLCCIIVTYITHATNAFNAHRYLIQIGNIFLSFCLILTIHREHFVTSFLWVLFVLTAYSAILFVPYYFSSSVFNVFPTITNSAGYKFKFVGLAFFLVKDRPYLPTRNWGWFREPGVFGVFLVAGLCLSLFYRKNIGGKKWLRWVFVGAFCFGIATTFSTTAIIAASIVLIFGLFRFHPRKKSAAAFRVTVLCLIVCFFISLFLAPNFFKSIGLGSLVDAFNKIWTGSSSFTSRLFDQFAPWVLFAQSPIFGLGFGDFYDGMVSLALSFGTSTNGGINSFFQMFGVYGFLFGALCIVGAYRFFGVFQPLNLPIRFCSFLALFLCAAGEDMTNSLFFFLVVFTGLFHSYPFLSLPIKTRCKRVWTHYEV